MGVDHALDFSGFCDWVEVCDAFGDLNDFCCNGFTGSWSVGREKQLIELLEILAKALDAA